MDIKPGGSCDRRSLERFACPEPLVDHPVIPWYLIPLRFLQALALAVWPLDWQCQVYNYCTLNKNTGHCTDK